MSCTELGRNSCVDRNGNRAALLMAKATLIKDEDDQSDTLPYVRLHAVRFC
jgi:hypothetical protein